MSDISPVPIEKIIDGYTYGRAHFSRDELHRLIPYVVLQNEARHTHAYEDMVGLYGHPDDDDHLKFYIGRMYDDIMDHSEAASTILSEMIQNVITRSHIIKHVYPHVLLQHLAE